MKSGAEVVVGWLGATAAESLLKEKGWLADGASSGLNVGVEECIGAKLTTELPLAGKVDKEVDVACWLPNKDTLKPSEEVGGWYPTKPKLGVPLSPPPPPPPLPSPPAKGPCLSAPRGDV